MATFESMTYQLGAATRQLHFRQKSSDEAVIKQVLVDQQYDLGRLARAAELKIEAIEANGRGVSWIV